MSRNFRILWVWLLVATTPIVVAAQALQNPLGVETIPSLLIGLLQWLLGLSAIIAILGIVVGGIRFVLAFGKEQSLAEAKKVLFWSIVGFALITLSFLIVNLVPRVLGVKLK